MDKERKMSNFNGVLEAQMNFSLNLLRETLAQNPQTSNILSPFSVAIALSMVYVGAKNETKDELKSVLGGKNAQEEEIHQYFQKLVNSYTKTDKNYTLESVNRVYVQDGFSIHQTFKDAIQKNYGGQFEAVNFTNTNDVVPNINKFVEAKTHNKIKDLVNSDTFNELTRLFLLNAVYFKGSWADKFDERLTAQKPFYVTENNSKDIINIKGLPYEGEEVVMYILLPKEKFGLQNILTGLDSGRLAELFSKLQEIKVRIPKFKLESTHDLNTALTKLGLENSFSESANFNGISDTDLRISKVMQKAFIEINEKGTEASAATGAVAEFKSMHYYPKIISFVGNHPYIFLLCRPQKPLKVNEQGTEASAATGIMIEMRAMVFPREFTADSPFLYLIQDKATKSTLFIGAFYGKN